MNGTQRPGEPSGKIWCLDGFWRVAGRRRANISASQLICAVRLGFMSRNIEQLQDQYLDFDVGMDCPVEYSAGLEEALNQVKQKYRK